MSPILYVQLQCVRIFNSCRYHFQRFIASVKKGGGYVMVVTLNIYSSVNVLLINGCA